MKRIAKITCIILSMLTIACCFPAAAFTASASAYNWAGAWGTPAIESGVLIGNDSVFEQNGIHLRDYIPANSTVRTILQPTIGGTKIRLKFSNVFGTEPITIHETTVAKTGDTDDLILTDTVKQVTFNGGQTSITIAAGSEVYSDEISFATTALEKISVSAYFKNTTPMYVVGLHGAEAYLCGSLGNRTHKETMTSFASRLEFTSNSITYYTIPFLTRVDVYAQDAYCVVLLGDSTITNDVYLYLAQKLHANGIHNIGVVMSGIIGNRLLYDGAGLLGKVYGQALLTRASRDAFSVAGVRYIIIKAGVNDVLHPMEYSLQGIAPYSSVSDIIQGYKNLAAMNVDPQVKMYLCTRTPYKGYTKNFMGSEDLAWTQTGENMLVEINKWVRSASTQYYNGFINLNAMRDPDDSTKLRSQLTTDGIHFSTLGQIAMADLIPEAAYGVNRELTDIAEILQVDPYTAPAAAAVENTTKSGSSGSSGTAGHTGNTGSPSGTGSSGSANTTVPAGNSSANSADQNTDVPAALITPNTTQADAQNSDSLQNANQILMEDGNGDTPIGSVTDNASDSVAARQMAGFAILAAVAVCIIAIAVVMLLKMYPRKSAPLTRGSYGRAKQKKRV